MSAVKDHATRCGRDVDEAAKTLNGLNDLYDELSREFQKWGSEVTQGDLDAISGKIAAQKEVFAKRSQELQEAVAALGAENKLEEEMRNEMKGMGL